MNLTDKIKYKLISVSYGKKKVNIVPSKLKRTLKDIDTMLDEVVKVASKSSKKEKKRNN